MNHAETLDLHNYAACASIIEGNKDYRRSFQSKKNILLFFCHYMTGVFHFLTSYQLFLLISVNVVNFTASAFSDSEFNGTVVAVVERTLGADGEDPTAEPQTVIVSTREGKTKRPGCVLGSYGRVCVCVCVCVCAILYLRVYNLFSLRKISPPRATAVCA